ncbi:MAG TPA: peroxiredoxin [Candidatus Angelobacter sp.]|jgi:peroxiredoxin Q/BCP|nr:peroxiredoxin [Candidatus Angelobacter sp.]
MHNILRFFAGLLFVASLAGCANYPKIPATGAPAPDFQLMNQAGKTVSLKDYAGKWVVLYFYPGDFGKRGTAAARSYRGNLRKFEEEQTVVIGISQDDVSTHQAFAKEEQLPFTLLSDEGQKVAMQYGSFRTRLVHTLVSYHTFIIDPKGKIARVFLDLDAMDPSGQMLSAVSALQQQ